VTTLLQIGTLVVLVFIARRVGRRGFERVAAVPLAPIPASPIVVNTRDSRWAWAVTLVVALATLTVALAQVAQSFNLNRSLLELHGVRIVDIEPASGGRDLVIAVTLRNLGGMPTTIYQAQVRATGSPVYPTPSVFSTNKSFPYDFFSNSPKEPFDKGSGLAKELTQLKAVGIEPATIVDLSPQHIRETLPAPLRVEARDVRAAPLYLRLRVEASTVDELRRLARERGEVVSIDLYDEEDRKTTIPVWDCGGVLGVRICTGVLFQ